MLNFNSFSRKSGLKHYHGVFFARKTIFYFKMLDRNYTKMDKNSNLSTPVRNITLKIWDLFFDLMRMETKLQQKLFDKGTLTWKNESHTQNEQQPNEMKKQNKINDFVNNPFQFDFFLVLLYYTGPTFLTLKVAAYLKFCHRSKFQASVSFSSIFVTDYVHIGYRNP